MQYLYNFFFVTAKCDFKSDDFIHNQDLHPYIVTHLPTKIAHKVSHYTWKYQHALKLKQIYDDIKDETS